MTLYQLTRLSDKRFKKLLKNGTINPSMKRNEASAETRKERKEADERRILSVEPAPGKKRALVIDPPWDYEWLSIAGRAQPGYARTVACQRTAGANLQRAGRLWRARILARARGVRTLTSPMCARPT